MTQKLLGYTVLRLRGLFVAPLLRMTKTHPPYCHAERSKASMTQKLLGYTVRC